MTRRYGRAPSNQRCIGRIPHGHYKTCTAIAALRHDRLCAPFLIDGPMNSEAFVAYIHNELLSELNPGDIVICDNLSSHKSAAAKQLLEDHGCQLKRLPAYSPDLNPIEQAFSKLKNDVCAAQAREYESLVKAVADSVKTFSSQMCQNMFLHAKYTTN